MNETIMLDAIDALRGNDNYSFSHLLHLHLKSTARKKNKVDRNTSLN